MKHLIRALFAFVLLLQPASAVELGDDGLYKQDWFALTFRNIEEDMQEAADSGKRLVMMFEQIGCIYCKKVHLDVLTDPEVKAYLQEHFMIVQYNLYGDEEVIDLDDEELSEKTAAAKWGVLFTPTIMFMPEEVPESGNAKSAAVAVMPGAFNKGTFLDFFMWVNEKGYESEEGFQQFHARKIRERTAAGIENTD